MCFELSSETSMNVKGSHRKLLYMAEDVKEKAVTTVRRLARGKVCLWAYSV